MPTASGRAWATEIQKASIVWPDSVRPLRSATVPDRTSGSSMPVSSKASKAAAIAALALSVSKIVSMRSRWQPPSTRPRICSAYASRTRSNVVERNDGSATSGEIDSVLLVGPIEPATNRGRSGVRAVQTSAARPAIRAAATFISRARGSRP